MATSTSSAFLTSPLPCRKPRTSANSRTHMTASTNRSETVPRQRQRNVNLRAIVAQLVKLESLTRPGALPMSKDTRYTDLPQSAQTPSQMLGRLSPGCEGTKGIFPRCNFACKPCYHSTDANRVRVDGMHTITEIARQMALLRQIRGSTGHCQLIGGEVSLLPPEDHALALETMQFFGRIPMSFTHGEFDYNYLKAVSTKDGRRRFDRIDFAVHFDTGMRGRKGAQHVKTEKELNSFRRRFVDMFNKVRREYGVRYYLAHNMTVTPDNISSLADALGGMKTMGFRLLSFQPAAKQGAQKRWVGSLRSAEDDDGSLVWEEIERGLGLRLPYKLFQMGDVRCNRMSVLGAVGFGTEDVRLFPLFDDHCEADVRARDLIMSQFGNIVLTSWLLVVKLARTFLTKPWLMFPAFAWCGRVVSRAGGPWKILRKGLQPITIVMHRFMDAEDVSKAWDLMEAGVEREDSRVDQAGPRIRETMERLASCSYAMAHPDEGRVVPACVQHSIYDPVENTALAKELSLREPARPASEANMTALLNDLNGEGVTNVSNSDGALEARTSDVA